MSVYCTLKLCYRYFLKFCEITLGSPGDEVDNDCDGLVDEEECATTITPGTIGQTFVNWS